jgi:hypothetical protein
MKLALQKEITPMSKIAISELFYELETTEQKTHRGGLDHGFSGDWSVKGPGLFFPYGSLTGPKLQMPSTSPRYMGPGWEPNYPGWKADLYGW